MKVSEIPYVRVDVEEIKKVYEEQTEKILNSKSAAEVLAARKTLLNAEVELTTASSLSYMRWSCNTKDEFYKGEKEYYENQLPLLSGAQIAYMKAMLQTPFRAEVEKALPAPIYKSYEVSLKALDERVVDELREESALVNQYATFMSEFTVDFDG